MEPYFLTLFGGDLSHVSVWRREIGFHNLGLLEQIRKCVSNENTIFRALKNFFLVRYCY